MTWSLPRAGRFLAALGVTALLATACSGPIEATNGPYDVSIADGLRPRLSASDAVGITRDYLDQQRPELAAPELHIAAHVQRVWAVLASDARRLDGCIPKRASSAIVWVTEGVGDYLNLRDHPWSQASRQTTDPVAIACEGPGPSGLVVIDDATGQILGVYPTAGPEYPHPSAG